MSALSKTVLKLCALLWIFLGASRIVAPSDSAYFFMDVFRLESVSLAELSATLLGFSELCLGVSLLSKTMFSGGTYLGAFMSASMLVVGLAVYARAEGRPCGCFGLFGAGEFGMVNILVLFGFLVLFLTLAIRQIAMTRLYLLTVCLLLMSGVARAGEDAKIADVFWRSVVDRESALRGRQLRYLECAQRGTEILKAGWVTLEFHKSEPGEIWLREDFQKRHFGLVKAVFEAGQKDRAKALEALADLPLSRKIAVMVGGRELYMERLHIGDSLYWKGLRSADIDDIDRSGILNNSLLFQEEWLSSWRRMFETLAVRSEESEETVRVFLGRTKAAKERRQVAIFDCVREWGLLPSLVVSIWMPDSLYTRGELPDLTRVRERVKEKGSDVLALSETAAAAQLDGDMWVPSEVVLRYGHLPQVTMRGLLVHEGESTCPKPSVFGKWPGTGNEPVVVIDTFTGEVEFQGDWPSDLRESVEKREMPPPRDAASDVKELNESGESGRNAFFVALICVGAIIAVWGIRKRSRRC